jgi:Transposase
MTAEKKLWRNRKEKKEWARRLQSEDPGLAVVHPQAAGIDVGNGSHYVAVGPDRDPQPVRRFECFTADLYRLADWLRSCGVKTVAMQSTGVYWIPLYDILEERGFEVYLVNARHTKNLPGRKSDVQESQWLLKLHTYGLLNNSFQPASEIRVLRTYWRQRAEHVRGAATCMQRMQKALTQMNVQLANVLSDISGQTGQAITRCLSVSCIPRSAGEGQPARDREELRRKLASGTAVCVAAGSRDVRCLSAAHCRVRPAVAEAPGSVCRQCRACTVASKAQTEEGEGGKECATFRPQPRTATYHGSGPDPHRRHRRHGSPDDC